MMSTSWGPESRRRLGDNRRLRLEGDQQGRIGCQIEVCRVFALQMKRHGFPEIGYRLVQRLALSDHGDVQALGNIVVFTPVDEGPDRMAHSGFLLDGMVLR